MERFDEDAPRPIPPIPAQDGATLPRLVAVMQRLLAPDGCPWDREQTYESLRRYVLEEACEVIDAIDAGDRGQLREELGDLLLQVVFQAELARNEASFAIDDVVEAIIEKLVRRHPHVFGHLEAKDADEVLRNWEKIKAAEKKGRPMLASVPRSLPAPMRAQRVGEKVANVGFDWEDAKGSRAKVTEELGELERAVASGDLEGGRGGVRGRAFCPGEPRAAPAGRRRGGAPGHDRQVFPAFRPRGKECASQARRLGTPSDPVARKPIPLSVLDGYWDEAKALERAGKA